MGIVDVNTIEEQHVEVNVEVHRPTESLDQGDRAGLCRTAAFAAGFNVASQCSSAVAI